MNDEARARSTDPETSHEAAASLTRTLPKLEAMVLAQLHARGEDGATSHELAMLLDLPIITVSPRLAPLAKKRLIIDSGLTRRGKSGRHSIVWRVRREAQLGLPL